MYQFKPTLKGYFKEFGAEGAVMLAIVGVAGYAFYRLFTRPALLPMSPAQQLPPGTPAPLGGTAPSVFQKTYYEASVPGVGTWYQPGDVLPFSYAPGTPIDGNWVMLYTVGVYKGMGPIWLRAHGLQSADQLMLLPESTVLVSTGRYTVSEPPLSLPFMEVKTPNGTLGWVASENVTPVAGSQFTPALPPSHYQWDLVTHRMRWLDYDNQTKQWVYSGRLPDVT